MKHTDTEILTNRITLRTFVANEDRNFNFSEMYPELHCGTMGCIGGAISILWPETRDLEEVTSCGHFNWNLPAMQDKLGLSHDEFHNLCFITGKSIDYSSVTRAEALTTLDHLIQTGEVHWNLTY